jgi:hypothetical protein
MTVFAQVPKWRKDNASRYSCDHFQPGAAAGALRPYTEKYEATANFSFAVMDPASQYWQQVRGPSFFGAIFTLKTIILTRQARSRQR